MTTKRVVCMHVNLHLHDFFPVLVDGMTFLEMENTSFIATMRGTLRYEASFEQLMNYKRTVMG